MRDPGDRQPPEFHESLRFARRVQVLIVSAEMLLGVAAGVVVGVPTDSIAWGIVSVVAAGVVLVVLGSVIFGASGGRAWVRRRGAPPS